MNEQMRLEADAAYDLLTPTEYLAIEVLLARYRLGEKLWTFDSRVKPALERMEAVGLVNVTHGMIEKTVRASLTELGKALLSETYVPPVLKDYKKKKSAGW